MNSTPSTSLPRLGAAALLALCLLCSGCAIPGMGKSKATSPQPIGQLTSHQRGDEERAIRMAQDWLREEKLTKKYDVRSATVRRRGDKWEVCFTPISGPLKMLRRRCIEFDL